jgi:hypothetical protein
MRKKLFSATAIALFCTYLTERRRLRARSDVSLSSREALLWLNEDQTEAGSFWE